MARRKGSKTIYAHESYFRFRQHQRMRMSVKTTKAISEQLGKAGIEKTRYYPQSQLLTKQAPGITFSYMFRGQI